LRTLQGRAAYFEAAVFEPLEVNKARWTADHRAGNGKAALNK